MDSPGPGDSETRPKGDGKLSVKTFITNEKVAWEVPPGKISRFFLEGAYLPPQGWRIVPPGEVRQPPWIEGSCGELRKELEVQEANG